MSRDPQWYVPKLGSENIQYLKKALLSNANSVNGLYNAFRNRVVPQSITKKSNGQPIFMFSQNGKWNVEGDWTPRGLIMIYGAIYGKNGEPFSNIQLAKNIRNARKQQPPNVQRKEQILITYMNAAKSENVPKVIKPPPKK